LFDRNLCKYNMFFYSSCHLFVDVFSKAHLKPYIKYKLQLAAIISDVPSQKTSSFLFRQSSSRYPCATDWAFTILLLYYRRNFQPSNYQVILVFVRLFQTTYLVLYSVFQF